MITFRCWHLLTLPSAAWLAGSAALAIAAIAWRSLHPSSYARWRELPAAALTYLAYGTPATWLLMKSLLDEHSVPAAGAADPPTPSSGSAGSAGLEGLGSQAVLAAAHIARLAFASGAVKECANALSLRVRLGCACAWISFTAGWGSTGRLHWMGARAALPLADAPCPTPTPPAPPAPPPPPPCAPAPPPPLAA